MMNPDLVNDLSPKQRDVLNAIIRLMEEQGYSPSIHQLCQACGVSSTSTIHHHLTALKKKGLIHWNDNERRAITLNDALLTSKGKIPMLGTIAAGSPLQTWSDSTETLDLSEDLCQSSCYALRVKGDSMIEDHIMHGDVVLINPDVRTIRQGDVVVALVEGETATLKRYYVESNGVIRLQPANATMDPMYVPPDQLVLQGKVEALIRQAL